VSTSTTKPRGSAPGAQASRDGLRPEFTVVEHQDIPGAQIRQGGVECEQRTCDRRDGEGSEDESLREGLARNRADVAAFERVVAHVRSDLYRYAFWLSRNTALADDLVQEALIRGWRFLPSLRDGAAAKQWLLAIVRREYARTFERKRLMMVDIEEINVAEAGTATEPPDPDVATLRRAIFELEADYREPLVLQVLLGYSTEDIARMIGITRGATLTRLFRARKKLAAALDACER
jgi:RNA polymerase sigma-70 factor (ECF subfamily)